MYPAFDDLNTYWFTQRNSQTIDVYRKSNLNTCVDFISAPDTAEVENVQILQDLELYKQRPEWLVGKSIDREIDFSSPSNNTLDQMKSIYDRLIRGVICLRAFQATKNVAQGEMVADKIIKYLESTDFYTAPASTMYHESVPSGLLFHSLKVYNEAVMLQGLPAFQSCNLCKWVLSALVHDWCKIGLYESYMRNVKNEETGQWEKVPSFRIAAVKRNNTLGHGAASMFLISQFVHLSLDEALAIRWHMGTWNVCDTEMNDLQDSNERYPLVHMIQFADQLAITEYESERYRKVAN